MRYRVARALATRINAPNFRPIPIISGLFSTGSRPHSMTETRILVLIPARMAATRPARQAAVGYCRPADDRVHVLRRAEAAQIGRVAVATDTPEIAAAVTCPWL